MGFSTMDRERGRGAVWGSAPGTASEEWEWELYGVQYREQRIEDRRDAEEPEWGL